MHIYDSEASAAANDNVPISTLRNARPRQRDVDVDQSRAFTEPPSRRVCIERKLVTVLSITGDGQNDVYRVKFRPTRIAGHAALAS